MGRGAGAGAGVLEAVQTHTHTHTHGDNGPHSSLLVCSCARLSLPKNGVFQPPFCPTVCVRAFPLVEMPVRVLIQFVLINFQNHLLGANPKRVFQINLHMRYCL